MKGLFNDEGVDSAFPVKYALGIIFCREQRTTLPYEL